MKVGFIQFAPVLGDVRANMTRIESLLAHVKEADLVVLPELCNSGYNFESPQQARETAEDINNSDFIRFLESLCRKNNLHIVSGFNEQCNDRLYNTAVLVGPEGYLGRYRKMHLFMYEKDYFTPGDAGLPVFTVGEAKIGILICFDWIFPEVWRILALKGADIICHPSNLVIPGLCQKAIPIHAIINRIYVILANRIGTERNLTFTGRSTIVDPKGNILAQAADNQEESRMVEIVLPLARDKMITPRNHILADRRPAEYTLLVES
jgi:predicted amidohydrolase